MLAEDSTCRGPQSKAINYEQFKMSKTHPQPKAATKKSSKTSSTPTKDTELEAKQAHIDNLESALGKTMGIIDKLVKFHEEDAAATEDDLRIYWDVRIVRGKDTPYTHSQGSGHLPKAFSRKLKPKAPGLVQKEIMEKIADPITAVILGEIENDLDDAQDFPRLTDTPITSAFDEPQADGDKVMEDTNEGDTNEEDTNE